MLVALLFAWTQQGVTPTQVAPAQPNPLVIPPIFAEPKRMALTPIIDGKLDPEEWDELISAGGMTGYLQWEPGKLHVAGRIPAGMDLVVSMDQKSDGWLVGNDNVEFRFKMVGGRPTLVARDLDATRKEGPTFIENPGFNASSSIAASADGTFIEATLVDPGTDSLIVTGNSKPSFRLDVVPSESPNLDAFLPRTLARVEYVFNRSTALPAGLVWNSDGYGRVALPGDRLRVKYGFRGTDQLAVKRIQLRGEGWLRDSVNLVEKPFPMFTEKKRTGVDFDSAVDARSNEGWGVLRATLQFANGPDAILQNSVRVAPLVDLELVPNEIKAQSEPHVRKMAFYIRSNSPRMLRGSFQVALPANFEAKTGYEGDFTIGTSRGSARRVIGFVVPKEGSGTYPIKFTIFVGPKKFEVTRYFTVF
ncbi:MAG: hypothetical protein JST35_05040 [Armatimonadetes bacterium]|nr:hypothetical protein [Armatimonadota bacterium]